MDATLTHSIEFAPDVDRVIRSYRNVMWLALLVSLALMSSVAGAQDCTQEQLPPKANASLTGHYEGNASNGAIPLAIDINDARGKLSGTIASPYGLFPVTGGAHSGDQVCLEFDAGFATGLVKGSLQGGELRGSYRLGDDSGTLQVRKIGDTPKVYEDGYSPFATPILILGVYHMSNPGLDELNVQADDVLSSRRQQEIEALVEKLARFAPTKIAVEAPYRDDKWPTLYQEYLAGRHQLGRNEIEQIGFRLAKRLHLPTIYGVDYMMFMNGLTPSEMELPGAGKAGTTKKETAPLSAEDRLLRSLTVSEYLQHLNSTEQTRRNQAGYMMTLLPDEDPAIYKKADLIANWHKRNLRIFSNINRITVPGKDRVLVIFGAGHLSLLLGFAAQSPYFKVVDTESFLK